MRGETFKYHSISFNIMEIKAIARKWGSSIAVIIPQAIAEKQNIKENVEITIEIKKSLKVADIFGKFPNWGGKSTQEIKDEMRAGWD